ncbi:TonB-dependent receptor [Aquisalinus flavus]|uniref:Oar protein n=1 Tax=Aquisalinus flavus TaxID=1526572 RepID=A0A8J2V2J1_9PROT|nr:TonB-dependent receptor [Aquisalinus flavus]MBD0426118.1 TonB-dependent receptor [Aquisalinus flavus]UNE48297.1 TonB-dependent receptor [Aquisalinus flavus]GGD10507.1 Oar protein [Aquisalinus flavus]
MKLNKLLVAGTAALAITAAWGGSAVAQETTSSIRGTVTDENGAPISGATVSIINEQTGFSRTLSTTGNGQFSVRNLPIGGNYVVIVESAGFQGERLEDLGLELGSSTNLTFDLAEESGGDEIVIVARRTVGADLATGPSSVFNLDTLQNAPAINRDLKDVIRIDPRVYLDESFAESIQCAGANPRFNSLTVDGIRLNDNFGLNSNGYPTERIPFSYDAIEQVAVELAPFDVEYGSFTACNINAVTKSGTNEFHGGAFFDYTNDSLRGDEAAEREIDNGDFDEYRYGINVGGPIIQDKLFFFAAYEYQEGSDLFGNNTPTGKGITDAEYQRIIDIARDVYGYETGGLPTALTNEDEKFLLKLDWNINDFHRASFTYNYNDGYSNSPSDGDPDELPEFNHFYQRGATLNSYAGSLYSDWTENLSTEVRVSFLDLDNIQNSYGGLTDQIGEVQIEVGDTVVYLGPDDSRHANELNYELWTYKAKADYSWNDHLFTVGIEREEFEVFNLFVQRVQGQFLFSSIDDFENGDLDEFLYQNASGTNDADDGAAEFGYEITTLYAQDEWQVTDQLNLVLGLRGDFFTSDDKPAFNPNFLNAYGIRNDDNLDGKSVIQPRLGFTYDWSSDLTFRGGVGLYSGGNPNVWISNNYSNNGQTLAGFSGDGNIITDYTYSNGGTPLFDIPDEALSAVANASGAGAVNALDPDFEIPSEWKYSLGLTHSFDGATYGMPWAGNNFILNADLLYSRAKEAAIVKSASLSAIGTAPDGRPIVAAGEFNPFRDDYILTNTDATPEAFVASIALSKSHEFGLDWTLGYAYTDSRDVNPMTSSVASSNYANFVTTDPNNAGTATSDYEIPHRFTLQADYEHEFVAGYGTRFSLFGQVSEGSPYSLTYGNSAVTEINFLDRQLLYVPNGANDPLVTYDSSATENGLLSFLAEDECYSDYRGEIIDRNACHDDWWTKFDLKITQNLPGLREGDRTQAFVVLENVGNFLNSDWGVLRQQGFPGAVDVVNASIVDGQYRYSNFRGEDTDNGSIQVEPSLWEIRFGVNYDF